MPWWIKLHSKILDRWWYSDINVRLVFFHLLLTVNYKEKEWRGIKVLPWQLICWSTSLAESIGISRQQLRLSLDKLKTTNEITIKTTSKYSIITVVKRSEYQSQETKTTNKTTNKQPTNNQQTTTTKEYKNIEDKKEDSILKEQQSWILPETEKEVFWQPAINDLIVRLKLTCDELGIAYNKDMERKFWKHICTAKEFWQFVEKVWSDRVKFACDILKASKKINFWKWTCSWPKAIYQNYAEVYNKAMEAKQEKSRISVVY